MLYEIFLENGFGESFNFSKKCDKIHLNWGATVLIIKSRILSTYIMLYTKKLKIIVGTSRLTPSFRKVFKKKTIGIITEYITSEFTEISVINNTVPKVQCYEVLFVCVFQFSVRILENTDQKKLHIWTLFMQCNTNENALVQTYDSLGYLLVNEWSVFFKIFWRLLYWIRNYKKFFLGYSPSHSKGITGWLVLNQTQLTCNNSNLYIANSKFSRRQIFSLRFSKWDTYYLLWEKKQKPR